MPAERSATRRSIAALVTCRYDAVNFFIDQIGQSSTVGVPPDEDLAVRILGPEFLQRELRLSYSKLVDLILRRIRSLASRQWPRIGEAIGGDDQETRGGKIVDPVRSWRITIAAVQIQNHASFRDVAEDRAG